MKRSKTFAGISPGSSSADIIKQRAREVREASFSPPPFLAGVIAENGADGIFSSIGFNYNILALDYCCVQKS